MLCAITGALPVLLISTFVQQHLEQTLTACCAEATLEATKATSSRTTMLLVQSDACADSHCIARSVAHMEIQLLQGCTEETTCSFPPERQVWCALLPQQAPAAAGFPARRPWDWQAAGGGSAASSAAPSQERSHACRACTP